MRKIKTFQLFPSAVITDTCSFLVGFINLSVENVCTNFTNSFILSGRFYISLRKINIIISGFHDIHDEHKTVTQQEIILIYLHVSKIVNIYNSNCHLAMTKCLVRCTMLLVLKVHEDEFPINFFSRVCGHEYGWTPYCWVSPYISWFRVFRKIIISLMGCVQGHGFVA